MFVSTKSIDITPHNEVMLCGYINEKRMNQKTREYKKPIKAVLLYLEIEKEKILFVTLDVLSVKKEKLIYIKECINKKYEIDIKKIYIHAIHTHSGPNGFSVDSMGNYYGNNNEYVKYVSDLIIDEIPTLINNKKKVGVKYGEKCINGYYDNRNDYLKPFDNECIIVKFIDDNKNVVAEIINISVHSTVLGPENMFISYDLIGSIREEINNQIGVMPIVLLGTAADVSNRHYRQGDGFEELSRVSKGIADLVLGINTREKLNIKYKSNRVFVYELEYDNSVNHKSYLNELNKIVNDLKTEKDKTKIKLLLSSKNKIESKLKIEKVHKKIEIGVLDLEDIMVISFPGELTSIFGKILKDKIRSIGKKPLILTCCNDHHGYFIEKDMFGKCYESNATLIPINTTEDIIEKLENYI